MALTNEVQVGRFNSLLFKLLSMKEGAPSPVLGAEIVPGLVLESDRPEWYFPKGERLAWVHESQAAVAAQYSVFKLQNPAGSGVLAVVHAVQAYTSETVQHTAFVQLRAASSNAGWTQGTPKLRDTRGGVLAGATALLLFVRSQAGVPAGPSWVLGLPGAPAGGVGLVTPMLEGNPLPLILSPGFELAIEDTVVNFSLAVSLAWSERVIEESETR